MILTNIFQSTLPARGATTSKLWLSLCWLFQSTLPARGATSVQIARIMYEVISIHAPRTGSDGERSARTTADQISIHAPRTGSDHQKTVGETRTGNFNPRSPHGERLVYSTQVFTTKEFQSKLPARGATQREKRQLQQKLISIHAPRTGSDIVRQPPDRLAVRFQSTLPARGATNRQQGY